jgi:hypothetical protein
MFPVSATGFADHALRKGKTKNERQQLNTTGVNQESQQA